MKKILLLITISLFSAGIFAQSGIQFPKSDTSSVHKDYPYILPIWGQEITDKNIDLQLPFGLNVNYVYNQLDLELTHFSMNFYDGENLDDIINPETLNFSETIATTSGVNIRADAWVLPFLNFYGLYSRSQGSTKVAFQPQVVNDVPGKPNLKEITTLKNVIDVPAVAFTSNTYGIGSTMIYGWDNYFVSVDGNFTWSKSELIEETVKFFVGSARIGRRVSFKNDMKLSIYIGAMYRNFVDKTVNTGALGVPELDEGMSKAIGALTEINDTKIKIEESKPNPDQDKLDELYAKDARLNHAQGRIDNSDAINYTIKKEITEKWSTQIGFNWEINPNWQYRGELGYRNDQKFFMTGLQYRFGL